MVFFQAVYLILRRKHLSLPDQTEVFWISKTNIAGALEMHSSITIDSGCIEMLMWTANGFCSWQSATSKGCYSAERCPVFGRVHRQTERADMLTWLFRFVDCLSQCFLYSHCPGLLLLLLISLIITWTIIINYCYSAQYSLFLYNPSSMCLNVLTLTLLVNFVSKRTIILHSGF